MFNAKDASNIKDQATHFALAEACYKALPRRSRSRQSNESTVDSSCTSMEFTIKRARMLNGVDVMETLKNHKHLRTQEITWVPQRTKLRNDRGAPPRRRAVSNAHAPTKLHAIPTWRKLTNFRMEHGCTSLLRKNGLTTGTNTRSYNPTKEEVATP